jgi:hypothetical protein
VYSNFATDTLSFTFVSQSQLAKLAINVTAIVSIALQLLLIAMLVALRKVKSIRASSVTFMTLLVVGTIFLTTGVFTLDPVDDLCREQMWAVALGFSFMFGSLLLKSYRIYKIFHSKMMQVKRFSDPMLVRRLAAIVALDVAVLLLYTTQPGYECKNADTSVDNSVVYQLAWRLLIAFKFALVIYGIVIVVKSRNIDIPEFNERVTLGYAIYNIAFAMAVVAPMSLSIEDVRSQYVLTSVATFLLVWATLLIVFAPKFIRVWQTRLNKRSGGKGKKLLANDAAPVTSEAAALSGLYVRPAASGQASKWAGQRSSPEEMRQVRLAAND